VKNICEDPRLVKNICVDPRLVKNICVDPRLMKNICVDPRLVKEIHVNPRLVEKIRENPRPVEKIREDPRLVKNICVDPRLVKRIRVNPRLVSITLAAVLSAGITAAAQQPRPVFRSGRDLISIDVIVRDRDGNVVRGLTPADFEIREDGRPQETLTFSFQEVTDAATPVASAELLATAEARALEEARRASPSSQPAAAAEPPRLSSDALAGRRLIVLLFDVSSMQPEDVQRAVDAARKYVDERMTAADLVAVATIGSMLDVLLDFSGDRARVAGALATLAYTEGTATPPVSAETAAAEEEAAAAEEAAATDSAELDMFNNDVRLRALKALAETLAPIEQKKAIIYFSAGMPRSGQDNQVELRAATNAAVRANVALYPVDTRGLQAVVPGGDARQASGRGQGMFSGRGVAQQFERLDASADTLSSLAGNTGGRAFFDTNDFGEAFARVQRDMSAYYLLGYSSANAQRDGRFRRVQVRVKRDGLRVEARAGYYAARDFAHTSRGDRETQLQEQLFADVSATDLPVLVTGGWFRLSADKYYVPISVAVPGSAVPVAPGKTTVTLDVLGFVRDEQGRPVGRMRETLRLPAGTAATLAGKQVLYQSGVTLPPGRFGVKVVVRENESGLTGSFEAAILVPELKSAAPRLSSVVLSTQTQPAARGRSENPLIGDGVQLLPNLTHVVGRDQKMFFYFEVYDPSLEAAAPELRASLAFYRGKVKVLETPVVERTAIDRPDRNAAVFRLEVPGDAFKPGLYTCQINVIDAIAGKFAFPRVTFFVR
jgi:VWFA-related protein